MARMLRISCFEFVELGRKYSSFSATELRQIFATANVSKTGKLSYCTLPASCLVAWWMCGTPGHF